MASRLKIGIFHDGISIPPKEGISVHVYELARALSKQRDIEVVLVNADRGRATASQLRDEPFDTLLLPPDEYYSQSNVRDIINSHHLSIVQNYNMYYIASVLGPAAKDHGVPVIAEHHDLELELTFLRSNKADGQFYERTQAQAIEYSMRSRFMSSHDFYTIQKTLHADLAAKTFLMPVAFTPSQRRHGDSERYGNRAVFIGNMSYEPNYLAALDIINKIAPVLPALEFVIVGRGSKDLPVPHLQTNIKLLGEVDDLQPVLSSASFGIAPLSAGSGLKIKLITYLEMGLPVIGSSIAMHGFPDSDALIVANSPNEYAKKINALIASSTEWQYASNAAHNLFSEYFDITQTLPQLIRIYRKGIEEYRMPSVLNKLTQPDMSRFPWHNELSTANYRPISTQQYIKGEGRQ